MVLAFGMMVVGCDNGNGDRNFLDTLGLSTAAPSAEALAAGNLTLVQFNQVRDLLSGFRGWTISHGHLLMVWTGLTETQALGALNTVRTSADFEWFTGEPDFEFFPARESGEGFYVPTGTLMLYLD